MIQISDAESRVMEALWSKEPLTAEQIFYLALAVVELIVLGVAVKMGFGLVRWGPLLETGLTVASLPFGSLLGLFLLGTFDRGANARGALAGMIVGLATVLCVFQFTAVAYTWYFMIGALVTFATGSVASRLTTNHSANAP